MENGKQISECKDFVFIPVYGIRFKRKFSLAIKKPVRNIT